MENEKQIGSDIVILHLKGSSIQYDYIKVVSSIYFRKIKREQICNQSREH